MISKAIKCSVSFSKYRNSISLVGFLTRFLVLWVVTAHLNSNLAIAEGNSPVDRILVIVGERVITQYDLGVETNLVEERIRESGNFFSNQEDFRRQVLERLITRSALEQWADKTGIRVSDDEVNTRLQQFASEKGLSLPEYIAKLDESRLFTYDSFRERILQEAKISRLRQRELDAQIDVRAAEIDAYLQKKSAMGGDIQEYLAEHILVKLPEMANDGSRKKALEKIEEALQRIDSGSDFRSVAIELSEANDALEGGDLGWRNSENLPDLFLAQLANMRIGQRSDVFESSNGFHILFLRDKRGLGAEVLVQQTLVAHILLKVEQYQDEKIVLRQTQELRGRLTLGKEDFSETARNISEDPSAANGGELGWISPGQTVPEFEEAMNRLSVGDISQPVRTQFGFHLIKVLERRDADLSGQRERLRAEQTIRQQKLAERLESWVREVRDKTYIEFKL